MAKRINKEQNLELKFKSLLELEKDITNKEAAQLIGVPAKQTFLMEKE